MHGQLRQDAAHATRGRAHDDRVAGPHPLRCQGIPRGLACQREAARDIQGQLVGHERQVRFVDEHRVGQRAHRDAAEHRVPGGQVLHLVAGRLDPA